MSDLLALPTGLTFREPGWLALLLLVPLALLLRRRGGAPALAFAPLGLYGKERPPRPARVRLLPLPVVLQVAGVAIAVLAMARPVRRAPLPLRAEGLDVLLCLDRSSSMTRRDLDRDRTRLEVARDAAAAFVRARPDDRIGLVVFARYPDVRCPPTLDHDALREILDGVEPVESDGPEDATGIGAATARAVQVLRGSAAPSRVVVLLTDGEENVALEGKPGAVPPAHAGQLAAELGVRVHAIAVGTGEGGGPAGGAPVDTGPVERMAARSGGAFFEARDAGALGEVYARIDAMEKAPLDRPRFALEDRFPPFLAAALVLLLLGRLLGARGLETLP